MRIGFTGMTHLGLNSAVAAAEKGFEVVCHDSDPVRISNLAQHELPVVEPGLLELLKKNIDRCAFATDVGDLRACDVVTIAPDVPTNDLGQSDLEPITSLVCQMDEVLRPETILVILSQVPPGFTRRCLGSRRSLFYQVETLIFGRAIERALYPERIIVGCLNPGDPLPVIFSRFLESFRCPILPMRYESAELAKISINMCLVASVSVANTLAELCENIGANWSEIVPALKLDKRIGPHAYLAPGLGIAGGNLERDLKTVCNLADQHGSDAGVVRAWMANSTYRRDWVLRTLHREILAVMNDPVITVLGLAYKPDTNSIKNSASVALLKDLKAYRTRVFDPVVQNEGSNELDACEGADVLILMTPWEQFAKLDPIQIQRKMRGRLVIDPYGVLNAESCHTADLQYFTLGVT